MATAGKTHDITIAVGSNTYGFMLDSQNPFQEFDASAFTARVASAQLGYGDLGVYSIVAQEDLRHGIGFPVFTDEAGYDWSSGGVDARFDGFAQQATKLVDESTINEPVSRFMDCGGYVFAACGEVSGKYGVWKYTVSTSAWADQTDADVQDLQWLDLWADGTTAYLGGPGDNNIWKSTGDDSWTQLGALDENVRMICGIAGTFWAAKQSRAEFYYMQTDGVMTWGYLEWGMDAGVINRIVAAGSDIWLIKDNGIVAINLFNAPSELNTPGEWHDTAMQTVRGIVDWGHIRHADNGKDSIIGPDGNVWVSLRGEIRAYAPGGTYIVRTPPPFGITPPKVYWRAFRGFTVHRDVLYCIGRTDETNYREYLLSWNGSGWHILHELVAAADSYKAYTCYASEAADKLFISVQTGASTYKVKSMALSDGNVLPYPSYETTSSPPDDADNPHYLYSSRYDLGFIEIIKHCKEFFARSHNCSSGHRTIDVDYQIDDDGTWRDWGTITTSPYQELTGPSTFNTAKTLQFRFNFQTDSASECAYLDAFGPKLMVRPDTLYGLAINFLVQDNLKLLEGHKSTTKASTIRTRLKEIRDSKTPVTVDLGTFGTLTGYSTTYNFGRIQYEEAHDPSGVTTLQIISIG